MTAYRRSGAFLAVFHAVDGLPSIALFMSWQLAAFFCVGILFGNLHALAMEPLVGGFFALGLASLITAGWTERGALFRTPAS